MVTGSNYSIDKNPKLLIIYIATSELTFLSIIYVIALYINYAAFIKARPKRLVTRA